MPPKNQRRSHTKSKRGCGGCKQRRIKCDEVHPTCSNCERRQIVCDFSRVSTEPGTLSNGTGTQPASTSCVDGFDPNHPPQYPAVNPFQSPNLVSTKKTTELDVSDLELMHHYTSVVAPDFATPNRDAIAVWQTHMVRLGFKHEFLLRGILAVSALHLSYSNPDKKAEYDLKASAHQEIALSSFQETLKDVNESNCHALFAFSCFIVVLAFASSTKTEAGDLQPDFLRWFYLIRGGNSLLLLHNDAIRNSFLAPFLDEMKTTETHATHSIPDSDRIADLFRICGAPQQDREIQQAYNLAIHDLLKTFIQASTLRQRGAGSVLASFIWPVNLSPRFLELLSEQRPEAMVILGHYCVLIHWGDVDNTWFLKGWARYMLGTIKASIPESWHEHLAWPESIID